MRNVEDDENRATRAWRPSDEAPLHLQRDRRPMLIAAAGTLATAVLIVVIVFVARRDSDKDPLDRNGQHAGAAQSTSARAGERPRASDEAPAKPELPPWLELRVARVRIGPIRNAWDGAKDETALKDKCKEIAGLAGMARVEAGAVLGLACLFVENSQRQTDATLPDLQLLLDVPGSTYPSYVAFDQVAHTFNYSFVIPTQAIPENGILISVIDADSSSARGQEIGSVRISRTDLAAAVGAGGLLTLKPPGLELLEVEVRSYNGGFKEVLVKLDTAKGGMNVPRFPVSAGDIVRIEAAGRWKIGKRLSTEELGPEGYPGGGPKDGNLPQFKGVPHGAAVTVVGSNGQVSSGVVGPCFKFVAKYAGVVWVGVNDRGFTDNRGTAEFRVMKRGPNATQWASPGALLPCE